MSDLFYRAFEERYRGSRELIKLRLQVYLPFIQPLLNAFPHGKALDVGCGRGEWLELVTEQGFDATGVDLNEGMLQACRERGLQVEIGDAVAYLQELPSGSLCLISGFHIAEHLPFELLQKLVSEAKRVLVPGGLLILETPNPENITVGTSSFYLDPTHERPIPPALLSFLPEYYRYERVKILRLQESPYLSSELSPQLVHVIEGVSPDYAVVAQTKGSSALMNALTSVFEKNYGLTLQTLAERYQLSLDKRLNLIESQVLEVAGNAHRAAENAKQAIDRAQFAEAIAREHVSQLQAVYSSTSWRMTAPVRWGGFYLKQLRLAVVRLSPRTFGRNVLQQINQVLSRYPSVRRHIGVWARRIGLNHLIRTLQRSGSFPPNIQLLFVEGKIGPGVLPFVPTVPAAMYLPEPSESDKRWVRLTGHVEGHYSLAIVNRGLAAAFERINERRISFVPCHGQPYVDTPKLSAEQDSVVSASLQRAVPADAVGSSLSVVHHYPFIIDNLEAGQRGMLFFWEETSVPLDTIDHLNRNFDTVWVAAESVKRALLNSGCKPPVFVLPLGVDHLITDTISPIGNLILAVGQRMRFLHVSSVFERKGADVLLAAYLDAFTADDEIELYIKTFTNPHNQIHSLVARLSQGRTNLPRVIIDETELDDVGMLTLYRSAHAMILPTRGEGFNLPAAEALAMALPVVTTGASAQVDFCAKDTATLVNFHYAFSRSHLHASDACWLEPDCADLTSKLQSLRQRILSNDAELQAQREAGMRHVRNTYTWDHAARALLASAHWVRGHSREDRDTLNIDLFSPWRTRCGVAEYSEKLMRAMQGASDVRLRIFCDTRTQAPSADAEVCWALGDDDQVLSVLERMGNNDAHVILVQHQPSLFGLSDANCAQLAALSRQGKVVMLELHSTLPLLQECRLSSLAVSALSKIDRIIVHKPEDLNHLLTLGLANNVMLLHLGVVQPLIEVQADQVRSELGIPTDALILGCFGFALAHKGIDTLVRAIQPLAITSGRVVHLLAVNSILDGRSESLIKQCQSVARQLGVADKVHWITDYQPIEACQRLLNAADYIIFPYRHTRESASGAVTIGISTLRPVLVSPLDIFSDVLNVTFKMSGNEVDDIVRSVQQLQFQPELRSALIKGQRDWLKARDWDALSPRLLTVMRALRRERHIRAVIAPAQRQWQVTWNVHRRKQLHIDVSELYHRDARTGIQRVVRSVLNELLQQPPDGFEVCPVYGHKSEGYRYTGRFHPHGSCHREGLPMDAGPGDVFLGLDLAAHLFPEATDQLTAFRQAGGRVYFVVYDIIPLLYPQFTVPGMGQAFDIWLRSLTKCANGLVCISAAVAKDVTSWLREHEPVAMLPSISVFHLGADIERSTPTRGLPADAQFLLSQMEACVNFLMVGTIEPRKGYIQTLNAFDSLWSSGHDIHLVLVGKKGWNMESFAQRLQAHPQFGKKLFWLNTVTDEYLEEIYRHSDCLIAASECEGFGLPLIEAAQYKLPVIARDIQVFREVAGDGAYYFKTEKAVELALFIEEWLTLYRDDLHPKSDNVPWLTWRQSTNELLAILKSSSSEEFFVNQA